MGYLTSKFPPRRDMLNLALGLDAKLDIVSICSSDNTNSLDILNWECFDALLLVSNQLEATNPTTVCEGDVTPVWVKFPTSGFVFHRAVVPLEFRIAFLPRLLLLAIIIEPLDSRMSTVGTGLTSLGIESRSKREFFGKYCTVGLQVVFRDMITIHPQAQALVTDELSNAYRLFNGSKLFLAPIQLVLVDQHVRLLAFLLFLDMLLYGSQDLSIERAIVLFGYLSYLFQQMLREPDGERFDIVFHVTILSLTWLHVKRGILCSRTLPTQPHLPLSKRKSHSSPYLKKGAFWLGSVTSLTKIM